MNLKLEHLQKAIFFLALFILIPLWNIPHTIAGRYTCEALLLITVFYSKPDWKLLFSKNKILLIFFAYLFFQLFFFSLNFKTAFSNFRGEWMHFILFSIIGVGVGLILGRRKFKNPLLYLSIAFSIPLYIHLSLSLIRGFSIGEIPWGYLGINEIKGDFGYPALEAGILLSTYYLYQAKSKAEQSLAITLILICIVSPLLAGGRGGTGFTITGIIFVFVCHFLVGDGKNTRITKKLLWLLAVVAMVLITYKLGMMSSPNRWGGISSRLSIGLEGDPTAIYCDGITSLEDALKRKGISITPDIQKGLDSVVDGDGTRVMVVRSGYELILKNPMGINQSKQAYQIATIDACKGSPQIFISHSHNAWIDTALAIGIPGAILLLVAMLQYAKLGYRAFKEGPEISPYGVALFASACIWILRGCLDSTLRDQMLEMQAFILALLLGLILSKQRSQPSG